jgi:hypothetical protein
MTLLIVVLFLQHMRVGLEVTTKELIANCWSMSAGIQQCFDHRIREISTGVNDSDIIAKGNAKKVWRFRQAEPVI